MSKTSGLRAGVMAAAWAATIAVAGCAHPTNRNLVAAEEQLQLAEADPIVVAHAPVPLHEAQTSVSAAREKERCSAVATNTRSAARGRRRGVAEVRRGARLRR